MYAIVETGSKQYKIAKGDLIEVEKLAGKGGNSVKLDRVLLVKDGKRFLVGCPYLKNVNVNCEVLGESKADKVISFKYRKRKASKAKIGHRQGYTVLKVKEIKTA